MAHSNLVGGSTAARVLACPASIPRSQELVKIAETTSPYAQEGTALHTCMEMIYLDEVESLHDCLGQTILGVKITQELMDAKLEPTFNQMEQLLDSVRVYGDYECEMQASFSPGTTLEGAFGTVDFAAQVPEDDGVLLVDYKFGSGMKVEVEDNKQLLFYAAAALVDPSCDWLWPEETTDHTKIHLVIIQPTFYEKPQIWTVTVGQVKQFGVMLTAAVHNALSQHPEVQTGDHCRWCPAAPYCPEKIEEAGYAIELDYKAAENLSEALMLAHELEPWIKQVKNHAHKVMEHGQSVDGFKLVNKRASRKWVGEDKVLDVLKRKRKLKQEDYADLKMKSPPQLEKVCKAKGVDFAEFNDYIVAVSSGTTLAPEDDPRPEVKIAGPREVPENLQQLTENA